MPFVDLNTVSRESLTGAKLSRQVSQGFPKIVPEFYSLKGSSRSGMAVTTDARDIIQPLDQMNNKGGRTNQKSFLLVLLFFVCTFLLSTGMIEISKDAESILSADQAGDIEITADGNISNILNLLISSFEERVDGIMAALRVLANTQEVLSGDWLKIKPLLMIFNESYEGLAMYIEANGDYYTVQRDWTGLNLSDRGYFSILQSGHEVSGYRVMSRSTGKRSIVFGFQ